MATLEDLLIKIGIDSKGAKKGAEGLKRDLSKTWDFAKQGAAVGGAAVGAALIAGMQSVIESSKPVALLQAQLGGSAEFAGAAGKAAGDLYARGVVDSMDTAAGTIKALFQNGLLPQDAAQKDVDRIAGKLSTLSTISEEESGKVAAAVQQMVRNGIVKNVDDGMDLMVKGVQGGVNKSEDLFDTFNEYGTKFRDLGLDGATAMGLMSQAIKAGARDSDTAADALKEFSIRAIDGSKAAADGYKLLGLDAGKMTAAIAKGGDFANEGLAIVLDKLRAMKDPVKRNAAAVGLFGTKAEDLGEALFAMNPETAAKELGNLGGAADKAGQTLEQSAGAKLEAFKRKAIGELTEQIAKLLPAIEATFGWLAKNSSWVQPLAVGLGLLAAAIGVIVAVQWAWNAALAVSPVTWIVLGIIALIAVIVYLATKTKFFQTIWAAVWGFLKKVGAWFAGPFAGFFVMLWQKIVAFAKGVWNAVLLYFGFWYGLFNKVKGWAGAAIDWLVSKWKSFIGFIKSIPGRISGALSSMWNGLKNGFRAAINWVIGKWNGLSFTIPSVTILGKTLGGGTLSTPNIPMLADGGLVPATPGGRLVIMGEGGEDEVAAPVSKLPDLGGDRRIVIELHGDDSKAAAYAVQVLRTAVKDKGGDVQFVLGQRKR